MDLTTTNKRPWRRARVIVATLCLAAILGMGTIYLWANRITAAGPPRTLWHAALPGLDIGIDTWPATEEVGGFVEVWYKQQGSNDYWPLLRLPGTPAQPPPRELLPGEMLA
jgi:hypothetical protein